MRTRDFDDGLIGKFRRKVLEQAERERRLVRFQRKLEYTSAALQEVTEMAPAELDAIADRVQKEFASQSDRFFSVPAQILWIAIPMAMSAIAVWLTAMLI